MRTGLPSRSAWSSDCPAVATISQDGLLAVSADTNCVITVSHVENNVVRTAPFSVTVTDVPVVTTGIRIEGPAVVDEHASTLYVCVADRSDGSSVHVSPDSWDTDCPEAAVISQDGLLTTGGVAETVSCDIDVSHSENGNTLSAILSVTVADIAPDITGIRIEGPASVDENTAAQYACVANHDDGSAVAVTPKWSVVR